MTARSSLPIVLAAALLGASRTTAQECAQQLYGANSANSIGLIAGAGVNPSWIAGGIARWDACGGDGLPALFCNQPGDYTFHVWYLEGVRSIGSGCGSLDPDLEWDAASSSWVVRGGDIHLYELDGFGFPCDNSDAARSRVVAHEIGHLLGLDDSNCTNIMGGLHDVGAEECAMANALWQTLMESMREQCDATCWTRCDDNAQCPPHTPMPETPQGQTDPLVFDLGNDGIVTFGGADAVLFDLYADGTPERVSWPAADDAFLYTDLNRNMIVDDGAELFGVGTILPDGTRARHGFEALAMYDSRAKGGDENGHIDSGDAIWNRLRLWRDLNGDGACHPGETAPIHRFGVREIHLSWVFAPWTDAAGTVHLLHGRYRKHTTGVGQGYREHAVEALELRVVD